jgi:hypothetical protein
MAFLPTARLQWQRQNTGAVVVTLGCVVGAAAGAVLASVLGLCPALLVKDMAVQPHIATIASIVSGGGGLTNLSHAAVVAGRHVNCCCKEV